MSDAIFVADPDGREYDPDDVMQVLSQIPGIANLKRGEGGAAGGEFVEADYAFGTETAHAQLLWPPTGLSLQGQFNAALMLALEFNAAHIRMHGRRLDLYNERYDYHQRLEENMTLERLRDLIENDPHAGSPIAYKDALRVTRTPVKKVIRLNRSNRSFAVRCAESSEFRLAMMGGYDSAGDWQIAIQRTRGVCRGRMLIDNSGRKRGHSTFFEGDRVVLRGLNTTWEAQGRWHAMFGQGRDGDLEATNGDGGARE